MAPGPILAGRLALPYEPELDYESFAVSVQFRHIATLPALLSGMSDAVIRAKRERLRSEHEKTQLQLMRLLDQIREVRTHSPRAHLAELALTAARARRTPRPISSII